MTNFFRHFRLFFRHFYICYFRTFSSFFPRLYIFFGHFWGKWRKIWNMDSVCINKTNLRTLHRTIYWMIWVAGGWSRKRFSRFQTEKNKIFLFSVIFRQFSAISLIPSLFPSQKSFRQPDTFEENGGKIWHMDMISHVHHELYILLLSAKHSRIKHMWCTILTIGGFNVKLLR